MSRRKQAKPRALKREDLQSAAAFEEESTQDTLCFVDTTKESRPSTPLEHCEISSTVSDEHASLDDDGEDGDEDEESSHFCDACKISFDSVSEYLEHVSQDCLNGGSSARSSDDLSPSPGAGTPSSSGSGADPDSELSFSVGVTEANPYGCQFCDKAFPRLSYLKRHEQIHSEQMPFRCEYCQRLFKHKRSRDRHVKLHTGDRKYRCAQCESAFSRSDHLKIHMRTHDNGKPYQCAVCNRGYNTAAALSSHMQNHKHKSEQTDGKEDDEKPLRCSPQVCPSPLQQLPFSSPLSESPRPPSSARMGMDSPNSLLNKKVEPTEGSAPHQLTCGFCSRSDFPSLESLQLHVQALHMPIPDPTLAASISSLHNMLLRRTDGLLGGECPDFSLFLQKPPPELLSKRPSEETYCSQCSTSFPNAAALLDHVRIAHSPTPPSNNSSSSKRSLSSSLSRLRANGAKHLKTSNLHQTLMFNGSSSHFRRQDPGGGQDNTLLCSQCTAAFSDFESFRTHLRSHLGGAAGAVGRCPQCGAAFSSEPALLSHLCGHLLTAEWGCPACGRPFAKAEELQAHLLEAHACRLYRCGLCAQIFDSKVSIQVHLAVKHSSAEQRTLKCSSCLSSFRSELDFQLHVKVQHLEQPRCFLQPAAAEEEEAQDLCTKKPAADARASSSSDPQQPTSSTDATTPTAPSSTTTSTPPPTSPNHRCDACDATYPSETLLQSHRLHNHQPPPPSKSNSNATNSNSGGRSVSLQCAYCGEVCRTRGELEAHTKTHTASPARHKCNICDEMCPSAATLAEHKLTHCKVVSGSTCTSCRAQLSTESQFLQHLRQHCAALPAPCPVCRQTLAADVEARSHARFHLRRHPCLVCGGSFEHALLVPRGHAFMCKACFHAKGEQRPCAACSSFLCKGGCESRCGECGVKFESRGELESHRRSVHQKRTFQCIKCQLEFATEREIQSHVAGHVLHEGTNHECRLCHEVLDSPSRLQCHLIEHTFAGCAHFTCYLCAAVFTGSAPLQRHMVSEHGLDARPYDCSDCGQRFFFRAELDNHALAVHGWPDSAPSAKTGGVLECAQCPSVFISPLDLAQHRIQQHESGLSLSRPPECDDLRIHRPFSTVCPKDLYSFEDDGLPPDDKGSSNKKDRKCFECHVCKKRFTRKENRRLHMKTHHHNHADAKPVQFPCSQCSLVFTKKSQLKEHARSHQPTSSGVQPSTPVQPCPVCGDTFETELQVEEHLEERHRPKVEQASPHSPSEKSEAIQNQVAEDYPEDENMDKDIKESEKEIESQTETDITSSEPETMELSCVPEDRTHHPPEVVA